MISFTQSCTNSVTVTASLSLSVIMRVRPHPQQSRKGKTENDSGIAKQENSKHKHSDRRQVSTGNTEVKLKDCNKCHQITIPRVAASRRLGVRVLVALQTGEWRTNNSDDLSTHQQLSVVYQLVIFKSC